MNPTDIDPELDSSDYIFQRLFSVRTTEEALRSEQSIEARGAPTTGYKQYDSRLTGMQTTAYLNIAKMAELSDRGHPVSLNRYEDAKAVYSFIQHHLESWMAVMQGNINGVRAPYDDLRVLDQFAAKVYGVAAHQYDHSTPQTAYGRFMAQYAFLSEEAFDLDRFTAAPPEQKIPERAAMSESLLHHQARFFG